MPDNNWKNILSTEKKYHFRIIHPAKTIFRSKGKIKDFRVKIKGKKITYPVYLDVEDNAAQGKASKSTLAAVCDTFCKTISAAGYKPGVYASLSWFNNKIGTISAPHTKWVAQYNKTCDYKGAYDMWQYSSSESVPGIASKTDVDWCYKKF